LISTAKVVFHQEGEVEVKIWLVQMSPKLHDKKTNLKKVLGYIGKASKAEVDLIAFPELALTGYMCRKKMVELAEPISGPSTQKIIKECKGKGIHVVLGMPELKDSLIHNSAVLIGPEGLAGVWRKLYLPTFMYGGVTYEENMFFKPGKDIVTFDTKFGKIGLEICYEIWYPEIARIHALRGAWLILCISAAPVGVPPYFQLIARVRALESVAWFAYVNQAGTQEGVTFGGGSCVVNHQAEIEKSASIEHNAREEVLEHNIEREPIVKGRLDLPILRDVRPEILASASKVAKDLYWPSMNTT